MSRYLRENVKKTSFGKKKFSSIPERNSGGPRDRAPVNIITLTLPRTILETVSTYEHYKTINIHEHNKTLNIREKNYIKLLTLLNTSFETLMAERALLH